MATIYQAHNASRQEIEDHVEEHVKKMRAIHQRTKAARTAKSILFGLLLAVCIGGVLALLFVPGLMENAQTATEETLLSWSDDLGLWRPEENFDKPFFERLLMGILEAIVMFFAAIASGIVYFLGRNAKYIVPGVLYLLALVLGVIAWLHLQENIWVFNPKKERKYAMQHLPEPLQISLAGLEGEEAALNLMRRLSDNCYVYTNLLVPYDGKVSETDIIVASPEGITIVEVKNHKNTIYGDLSDHDLTQQHVDRRGKSTLKTFYNPVKQVGTHVYRLSHYLRSHGVYTNISSCVLFVSPEVRLQLTDHTGVSQACPVFHSRDTGLMSYLENRGAGMHSKQFQKALWALDALVANPPQK